MRRPLLCQGLLQQTHGRLEALANEHTQFNTEEPTLGAYQRTNNTSCTQGLEALGML